VPNEPAFEAAMCAAAKDGGASVHNFSAELLMQKGRNDA
jgi:hypothetical protein